ncbi:MAG: ATP-dependent helicase [Betaproteobacteria bacterium]|nr:MAG: ATP-dependent helicase [Betaproteobacteria bacterium]
MPADYSRKIATSPQRHVEVLASPGSGKTFTLIRRIQHLLSVGVRPEQILVLSFSNASVRELTRRLDLLRTNVAAINVANTVTDSTSANRSQKSLAQRPSVSVPIEVTRSAKSGSSVKSADTVKSQKCFADSSHSGISSALTMLPDPPKRGVPGNPGDVSCSPEMLRRVRVSTVHAFARSLLPVESRAVITEKQAKALLRTAVRSVARRCVRGKLWPSISATQRAKYVERLAAIYSDAEALNQLQKLLALSRARHECPADVLVTDAGAYSALVATKTRFTLAAISREYARQKTRKGVRDFDDLLVDAVTLVERKPNDPTHARYRHMLVDEYQDSGALQSRLLAAIASNANRSLTVFGDPHQALYGFAGSSYTPLRTLLPDHDVKALPLPVSRRLTAANAALASSLVGSRIKVQSDRDHKDTTPKLVVCDSVVAQTNSVVERIRRELEHGTPANQIAVLARTRAQLHVVEAALRAANIPVRRLAVNSQNQRGHPQVIRVLRLVHLVDRTAMQNRKLNTVDVQTLLHRWAYEDGEGMAANLARKLNAALRTSSLESRYRICRKAYAALLTDARSPDERKAITHELGAWEPLCRQHKTAISMRDALRRLPADSVVTSTVHAAKGGEWRDVHVVGVTDGLLPIYKAQTTAAVKEERRLLYVACTRARSTVTLYHAPARHNRSNHRFEDVSRFLTARARKHLKIVNR